MIQKVLDITGKETGRKITLDNKVFGIEPNNHAIYLAVKQFLANQRQGNSSSKERWAITASTRKIKRQKGTGTARAGSLRSGVFVGGARIFGPQPRNFGFSLNKKVKSLARKSVLSQKAKENNVVVVEDFKLDTPKTKEMLQIRKTLSEGRRVLFVLSEDDSNVTLSARNLQDVQVRNVKDLNTYEIMNASDVIISEKSVEHINKNF